MFAPAVKHESKLRLGISGPSGSGKTYTALAIATALGQRVAVVDTESGSASKYADVFGFDVAEMHAPFHPKKYAAAIQAAADAGYDVIILDSLSHAWAGSGGLLDIVDEAAKRSKSGNTYMAWKEGTPVQNMLIEAIVTAPIHVIGTMRSKTEYALITDERGKSAPKKIGMAPIQRDGFEYEFDVMLDMDADNTAVVSKSRCSALAGTVIGKPGANVAATLREWLSGAPVEPVTSQPQTAVAQAQPAPLPADEAAIMQGSAAEFFDMVAALVSRYDNVHAAKNAAKKLGYGAIPKDAAARLEMYRAIRDHAEARDAEEAGDIEDAAENNTMYDKSDADGAFNSMH
jgi:hypothetical protein